VNYVNAPLIAAERGIEVREERRRASRDFTNLVRVSARSNGDEVRVAGTTIGKDNRHWLVSALGFELEMELAPLLVFFRYDDLPGVIGRVGTLFGTAGVNIANMAVSRTNRGGKALMALSVDRAPPQELVDEALREGCDVRFLAAPRVERRGLERATVRDRQLPRVRSVRVHRVQVRAGGLVAVAAREEDDARARGRHRVAQAAHRLARDLVGARLFWR